MKAEWGLSKDYDLKLEMVRFGGNVANAAITEDGGDVSSKYIQGMLDIEKFFAGLKLEDIDYEDIFSDSSDCDYKHIKRYLLYN